MVSVLRVNFQHPVSQCSESTGLPWERVTLGTVSRVVRAMSRTVVFMSQFYLVARHTATRGRARCGIALVGLLALSCLGQSTEPRPLLVGTGPAALFIGNSYLYTLDVPGIVRALADSAGGEKLATMTIAGPNYALVDHWNEGTARREIAERDFEWVVLQQGPSSVEINRDSLRMFTKLFADEVRKAGDGTPVLFSAWPSASRQQDFPRAIESYTLAASDVAGILVPVAAGWLAAWDRESTLQLYQDGLHPSHEGAYLSALVIYSTLLGKSPVGLPATIRTTGGVTIAIDPVVAATLQAAAASVVNLPE
jgi:hypothetical protein